MRDFVESLGKSIMGNCGSASARERLMKAIQSLRFSFSADAITGLPEIGVHMVGSEPELSLSQIFAYMENSNKPVYVALDEFQQIKNYPEKNVEETLRSYLATRNYPDPDLLIRTGGELRISNFLLWQMAYTEFYFSEQLWPDFRHEDFYDAVVDYQNRQRRFGKTGDQVKASE